MVERFNTVLEPVEIITEVKKSKFICKLIGIESEEAAKLILDAVKKEHYNASHSCHAFRLGEKQILERYSDDGEPSGTAGMPILEVLRGESLTNVMAVVTRYFGGTLLGTGGLVRAYTEAAKSALESANIITKVLQQLISVQVAYTLVGKLEYYIHQSNIEQYNVQYDEHVTYDILVNISQVEACMKDIRELTANRFSGDYKDIYYTYQLDGKLYLDTKVGD